MPMDQIAARLAAGQPPLRISELARLIGFSREYVRKAIDAGAIEAVQLRGCTERRVPVQEAVRLARELRVVD